LYEKNELRERGDKNNPLFFSQKRGARILVAKKRDLLSENSFFQGLGWGWGVFGTI